MLIRMLRSIPQENRIQTVEIEKKQFCIEKQKLDALVVDRWFDTFTHRAMIGLTSISTGSLISSIPANYFDIWPHWWMGAVHTAGSLYLSFASHHNIPQTKIAMENAREKVQNQQKIVDNLK